MLNFLQIWGYTVLTIVAIVLWFYSWEFVCNLGANRRGDWWYWHKRDVQAVATGLYASLHIAFAVWSLRYAV